MVNLFATPLGPGLILLLAALVLSVARQRIPRPVARVTALFALVSAAGTLLWVVFSGRPARLSWTWDPVTLPGGAWLWQVDGWSWVTSSILFLLAGVAIMLDWDHPERGDAATQGTTLMLAAAASFFIFSGNLLTLAGGWLLLDITIGLAASTETTGGGGRAWGMSSLGTWLLLGALLFAGPGGARNGLADDLAPLSLLAVLLAALLRCGAYPFHIWQSPQKARSRSGLLGLHLMAPLAGIWLLGELHEAVGPYFRSEPAWAALGALGMLGSSMAALLEQQQRSRTAWVAVNRVSLAVLVAVLSPQHGPAAVVWPLVMLTLGVGGLVVGELVANQWAVRQPLALAVLTLIAFPGTVGFASRLAWVDVSSLPLAVWPLWLVALAAEALLAAALLPRLLIQRRASPEVLPLVRASRLIVAAALVALPLLSWGLWPSLMAGFAGLAGLHIAPQQLLSQLRQMTAIDWVVLVLPWICGAVLAWARGRFPAVLGGQRQAIRRVVSLEWFYQGLRWAAVQAAGLLRGVSSVVEGEGYWGWLGLAVLLAWLVWNL